MYRYKTVKRLIAIGMAFLVGMTSMNSGMLPVWAEEETVTVEPDENSTEEGMIEEAPEVNVESLTETETETVIPNTASEQSAPEIEIQGEGKAEYMPSDGITILHNMLYWQDGSLTVKASLGDGSEFPEGTTFEIKTLQSLADKDEEMMKTLQVDFAMRTAKELALESGTEASEELVAAYENALTELYPFEAVYKDADGNKYMPGTVIYEVILQNAELAEQVENASYDLRVLDFDEEKNATIFSFDETKVVVADDAVRVSFESMYPYMAMAVTDGMVIVSTDEASQSDINHDGESEMETTLETVEAEQTEIDPQEKPFDFQYEDEFVSVRASCSQKADIPEAAILHAIKLDENSMAYHEAMESATASLELKDGEILVFEPYDVYFEYNGERIEPEDGFVQIEMQFKQPLFEDMASNIHDTFVAHIKNDGEVEQLENTSAKTDTVEFEIASFSIMGPAAVVTDDIIPLANSDEEAYAILYESGEMVFQIGNTPDVEKGTVLNTYTGFLNGGQPWADNKSRITSVSFQDTIAPTSTYNWFLDCRNLKTVDMTKLDTSNVSNMAYMFKNCSELTFLDVSGFNTSKVGPMQHMFAGCSSITVLDLSNFDTGHVYNMTSLLGSCDSLQKIILGPEFVSCYNDASLYLDWIRPSTGETYTARDLFKNYDGTTMADVYYRIMTITFEGNGGVSNPNTVEGYIGMIPDKLPTVTKKGAIFDGWYTEPVGGVRFNAGDAISQETYYAHWSDYQYTLVLKPNGADEDDVLVPLGYNELYQLSDKLFRKEGLILSGWNTRKDGSGTAYEANDEVLRLSAEDGATVILYAQWSEPEDLVTVTFDSKGGYEVPAMTMQRSTQLNELPEPERDGYTFDCWKRLSDGITVSNRTIINEDTELYAAWIKNPVVTFDCNGGGPGNTQRMVRYNRPVGELPDYPPNAKRYMSLIGWFTEPYGGEQITAYTTIVEDVTFYAHWGWQPKFNTNGGHIVSDETYSLQEDCKYPIPKLPTVERDGYVFDGWYLSDGATQVHDGDIINLEHGIEIVAHWKITDIVTIILDNGNNSMSKDGFVAGIKTIKVLADSNILDLPIPTWAFPDSEFLGWFDEAGNPYDCNSIFTKDMTLTAKWAEKSHTLTFNPGEGTAYVETMTVPDGGMVNELPGAKLQNYILNGWYTDPGGKGERLTVDTKITEDKTYYAYYVPNMMHEDDDTSIYIFGADWVNASNENVDNINDNLSFHPTDAQIQTASLHVRFEMNKFIDDELLPVGSVKITVPKYVWKDWDGNVTGTNNVSALLPEYPAVRNGMYFSYIDNGDTYILVNNQELAGGTGVDLTISYQVDPYDVPGGAIDGNGRYVDGYEYYQGTVPIMLEIDRDLDHMTDAREEKDLTLEMHTRVSVDSKKAYSSIAYTWNSSWGKKPSDADDYFYIEWELIATSAEKKINQPGTWHWSEDTVHDGTVVAYSINGVWSEDANSEEIPKSTNWSRRAYVVTKHPLSLLADIPEEGLKITNEAVRIDDWKSGYQTSQRVSASTTIYDEAYPYGEFDKHKPLSNSVQTVSGGQEIIVDDNDEVELEWKLTYAGIATDSSVLWDEYTSTYSKAKRTICIRDGVSGDLMYSSGAPSVKYVWEPVTGNITLSDEDYHFTQISLGLAEYDARQEYGIWTVPYLHSTVSDLDGLEIWIRKKHSNEYVFYRKVYVVANSAKSATVYPLPEDTVGFEIRHTSDFYATELVIHPVMKLMPTEKIKSLISDDLSIGTTSLIKNRAVCDIWNTEKGEDSIFFHATDYTGGLNNASKEIWELTASETEQKTRKYTSTQGNTLFDVERGTQDNPVCIYGWNTNNSKKEKYITTGTFYDLLPAGTTVDESTLFGVPVSNTTASARESSDSNLADKYDSSKNAYNRLDSEMYDVRFVNDWEGSGRTMMVIKFTIPETQKAVGIDFYYLLHNTYENILEKGTTVENDVAFVNTSPGRVLPTKTSDTIDAVKESQYYQSLLEENKGFISFAQASTNYIPVDAFSWGFDKTVKTLTEYEQAGMTIPNNEYIYRLSYSQSDYASSSKITFFDILEHGIDRKSDSGENMKLISQWHGTLKNVDVSSASEKLTDGSERVHCAPVIYYSTKNQDSFTGADYDVTNTVTWTTKKPADESSITAIAIDCSKNEDGTDFVMKGRQVLEIYVTMQAPKEAENIGRTAYNEGVVYVKKDTDEEPEPEYSDSEVTMEEEEPEIHKSSDPETGTKEAPAVVRLEDELSYTISVKNTDTAFTLHDIVLKDLIPDGLNIDTTNIKVHFGDASKAIKLSLSPRVSLAKSGQNLIFAISSLLPEETIYFEIPTIVIGNDSVLENTAVITSVNGVEKELKSETTYHEILPIGVVVKKRDVGGAALPGAVLQLLDSEKNVVAEWISTEKPEYIQVSAGTYIIHEVRAPEGYLVADDIMVTVNRIGVMTVDKRTVDVVEVIDKPALSRITLTKVDMDDHSILLEGVEFGIYSNKKCTEDTLVSTMVTDAKGIAFSEKLELGTYYVKETKPKVLYLSDDTVYTVEMTEGNQIYKVSSHVIENKAMTGSVKVLKFGSDDKTSIKGVAFELNGEGITKTLATDENGEALFTGLNPGTYTITETKTVAGLSLLPDVIKVTLPLTMTTAECIAYGVDTSKGYYVKSEDKYYFFDLAYDVTNNVTLSMPVSGGHGLWMVYIGGSLALFGIYLLLAKLHFTKRHKT